MRILSNFRDYYDTVQAQGQDQSIIYHREEREFTDKRLPKWLVSASTARHSKCQECPFPVFENRYSGRGSYNIRQYVIGVCGKIYSMLKISKRTYEGNHFAYCYNIADVDEFVLKHDKKYFEKYSKGDKRYWRMVVPHRSELDTHFTEFEKVQDRFMGVFVDHKCPVFMHKPTEAGYTSIANYKLAGIEFYRVLDPFVIFQELQMFVGGILAGPEKAIPVPSDVDMVYIKGFDKFSFRKPKGTKKKKPKTNT